MLRVLLKERIADYEFVNRRKLTVGELSEATGVSRSTLQRISNVPDYKTTTDVLGALCEFFDCEPGELLARVKE